MNPGKLNELITIQYDANAGGTKNDGGEPVESWQTFKVVWAEFMYKPGIEATQSEQVVGITKVDIKIRRLSGVKQAMRVKDSDDNYYDISGLQPLDKMYMILTCYMRDNANVS